ncbi:hypothetical protein CMI37_11780 [Candidatus Pacearchaeota archaeon]|nr:hypothetical protein [Candidatus Pacearchaeota archaeon]|tara:strand:- start:378 stop:689 length:312 start_codon:yes stop_codon:yes gene_type:complete
MKSLNKYVTCKDGFSMSVQANSVAYCRPRVDDATRYTAVEVGYPSQPEPLLASWAEDPKKPTNTVYGYVPVSRISLVCVKHGGVVSGDLPPGIPRLETDNENR